MGGFSEGYSEGRKTGNLNPWVAVLKGLNSRYKMRLLEDIRRERQRDRLRNFLARLGLKYAYERKLRELKGKNKNILNLLKGERSKKFQDTEKSNGILELLKRN